MQRHHSLVCLSSRLLPSPIWRRWRWHTIQRTMRRLVHLESSFVFICQELHIYLWQLRSLFLSFRGSYASFGEPKCASEKAELFSNTHCKYWIDTLWLEMMRSDKNEACDMCMCYIISHSLLLVNRLLASVEASA